MLEWFYSWLDPKILRLEKWVNQKVVTRELIDIDLDKAKKGEVTQSPNMFRNPPSDGAHGPFIANLTGGEVLEYMHGTSVFEAFALISHDNAKWWRHRDGGTTSDFKEEAFSTMQEFFHYIHGDNDLYWECQLRSKAMDNGQ